MTSPSIAELSDAVNEQARRQYPRIAKMIGESSLLTTVSTRLALRTHTPYPYSFTEDDSMLPPDGEAFGRVIRRDRQVGLEEIRAATSQQDVEHGWLYVPDAEIWLDTTQWSIGADVGTDPYAAIFLSHVFPDIEAVHTHPDNVVKALTEENPWGYSQNYLLEAAQPSVPDLIAHYMMRKRVASAAHYAGGIVSHYGLTTYRLSEAGISSEGFRTSEFERHVQDASDPISAIRTALDSVSRHATTFDDEPAFDIRFEPLI